MQRIFYDARVLSNDLSKARQNVAEASDICSSPGNPLMKKKVLFSLVDEAFNEELKADFTMVEIRDKEFHILNIVDVRTG